MIEKTLKGKPAYWIWLAILGSLIAIGWACYFRQYAYGLGLTGMSRDVSWGLYISQFTFLVGVAAGGLMLVLPYYIHNYKVFGRITILGEFLAIAALVMCLMFIMADLGQPLRGLNVLFYPTPHSMLFWDMCVLWGYLLLNLLCGWVILTAERKQVPPPKWIYFFVYLSLPFAVSIHTVTAMLYCGLPGRHFWLSAIIAPRFLASAFAAGPSLILIEKLEAISFESGLIDRIRVIVTVSLLINIFLAGSELFAEFYSDSAHTVHISHLFGLHGASLLAPWIWASLAMNVLAAIILLSPARHKPLALIFSCIMIVIGIWIEKGLGFVVPGFIPSTLGDFVQYLPSFNEIMLCIGIWAFGLLLYTLFLKGAIPIVNQQNVE